MLAPCRLRRLESGGVEPSYGGDYSADFDDDPHSTSFGGGSPGGSGGRGIGGGGGNAPAGAPPPHAVGHYYAPPPPRGPQPRAETSGRAQQPHPHHAHAGSGGGGGIARRSPPVDYYPPPPPPLPPPPPALTAQQQLEALAQRSALAMRAKGLVAGPCGAPWLGDPASAGLPGGGADADDAVLENLRGEYMSAFGAKSALPRSPALAKPGAVTRVPGVRPSPQQQQARGQRRAGSRLF
ncbi:hypothetical protein FOA52_009665 [Chlamydomonas sp. UWO 241]|nr:hypothetical protein FOA52_009665 [Chlamydomonas sp. UWO 241]